MKIEIQSVYGLERVLNLGVTWTPLGSGIQTPSSTASSSVKQDLKHQSPSESGRATFKQDLQKLL